MINENENEKIEISFNEINIIFKIDFEMGNKKTYNSGFIDD